MTADGRHPRASRAGRLVRTVAHMRPSQVARQLQHRLLKRLRPVRLPAMPADLPLRPWRRPWAGPAHLPRREVEPGLFRLLNESARVDAPADWNSAARSRLWLYNLHYLDDLAAAEPELAGCQGDLFERWIAANPPLTGVGWEPYPLSLRLVNAITWCSRQPAAPMAWRRSLFMQASALAGQIEYHILGNHLFANAKALVFCGSFFAGREANGWLETGVNLLRQQLAEQFLADGGHFERSPMYHAVLLWDVAALCHLADCARLPALDSVEGDLRQTLARGLRWLEAMTAVDGLVSFFNDSTLGVAPPLADVAAFARLLGHDHGLGEAARLSVTHLGPSGFAVLELGSGTKAIVDVGSIGPAYQPGHAHAETLAVEAGVRGHRVIVNCGISTYAEGADRRFQRSTAAHSTVEVAGRDSSETWASFRVGRRARVTGVTILEMADHVAVTAAHDGYRHLRGRPIHRRTVRGTSASLEILDEVEGGEWPAVARFHLHPDVQPGPPGGLRLADETHVTWHSTAPDARLVASRWHPEFGLGIDSHCIEVPLTGGRSSFTIRW